MRLVALSLVIALLAGTAAAAPIWIERRFVPDPELVDPVFADHAAEAAAEPDYATWDRFLARYRGVDAEGIARVGYDAVTAADRAALSGFIDALAATDVAALSREQQLAYWINLYNAATVELILEHYPVASIRDISRPWRRDVATVAGVALSLGDIEHGIVRALFDDPRIHYALNCASIGCPNLAAAAYRADVLDEMLDDAAREYVNHPRGVMVKDGEADVSSIYGWYREDFGGDEAAVIEHLREHAAPGLRARLEGVRDIDDYAYDWSLNGAAGR